VLSDFEQQRVGLAFDLERMDDPGVVVAGLIDEQDRRRADRDQHQKSR
jgi:hypothetical protein